MSYFICLVRPSGASITALDRDRATVPAIQKGLPVRPWIGEGSFAALAVGTSLGSSPCIAVVDPYTVVGTVRLDNRAELLRDTGKQRIASDVEVVGGTLRER